MRSAACILSHRSILLISLVHLFLLLLLLQTRRPPACVLRMSLPQRRSQIDQHLHLLCLFSNKTTYGMTKACAELLVNDCTRYAALSFVCGSYGLKSSPVGSGYEYLGRVALLYSSCFVFRRWSDPGSHNPPHRFGTYSHLDWYRSIVDSCRIVRSKHWPCLFSIDRLASHLPGPTYGALRLKHSPCLLGGHSVFHFFFFS